MPTIVTIEREKIVYVPMSPKMAYEHALDVYRRYRDEIRKIDERITTMSCGTRYQNGEPTGEFAIRIHVRTPADKIQLKAKVIAGHTNLRPHYEGVWVDIVATDFDIADGRTTPDDGRVVCCDDAPGIRRTGTIGTVAIGPGGTPVWVTAAHVMSHEIAQQDEKTATDCRGGVLGRTPHSDLYYRRNDFVDCAIILPKDPLALPTSPRGQRDPTDDDYTKPRMVEMWGTKTGHKSGVIDALVHDPILLPKTQELAVDHFLVRAEKGAFAQDGDSGAIVTIGNVVIGMVRGVSNNPQGVLVAVVCKLSHIQSLRVDFQV
ncbi:MAG: hypothetical protein QM775_08680 [Pirellulales bacterium]